MGQLIRARKSEDKILRKTHILKISKRLFESQRFESITMDLIAQKSNLAKGTLYLYFKTREEVFLDLQQDELFQWMRILRHQLELSLESIEALEFVDIMVTFTENQVSLMKLLSLAHPVLQANISEEKAKESRHQLKQEMLLLSDLMAKKINGLSKTSAFTLLFRMYSLLIGLCQTTNPELSSQDLDFNEEFKASLCCLVRGMLRSDDPESKFDFYKNY